MLQPSTYPRLLGQALTLEPDPFVEMADDDNPWIEGLFFVFVIGLLVAVARLVGGLLLSASLPHPDAVLEAVAATLRQSLATPAGGAGAEETLRSLWPWLTAGVNYGSGWLRLLTLISIPLSYILQWLVYGLLCHSAARFLGGSASLGQSLGVVALSLGPRLLLVATAVPFAAVGTLLLHVWGVLIAYRGLEVAHDLSPGRAAGAVLAPLALLGIIGLVLTVATAFILALTGGGL